MTPDITIRKYENSDCEIISELFYETVHSVNARDYSDKQLYAWAENQNRLIARRADLIKQNTLIAEIDGKIVGFGSITSYGCLDLLYVHKDFQRCGIATALCDELEKDFSEVQTYASVTAKPFFERRGYIVIKAQKVERSGIELENYDMRKAAKIADKL